MDELKEFIQNEILNLAFKKVSFDESLVKSKILDSVTFVELLVSIEEKTGKVIPQHFVSEEKMDTINMICAVLNEI